jgi:AraC-like DNA-binding protein
MLEEAACGRIIDGHFSGPSSDVEPRGMGRDFACGIRLYAIPPGELEISHRGNAHMIDLHSDGTTSRLGFDSDKLDAFVPASWSAAFVPADCEFRLHAYNVVPPTVMFVEPALLSGLCDRTNDLPILYWQHNDRIAARQQRLAHVLSDPLADLVAVETAALQFVELMAGRVNARVGRSSTRQRHLRGAWRAIDYLEAHLGESVDISALANVAAMSPFHFLRAFQTEIGETPHQYLIRRRVEEAQCALARTRESIATLAIRLGFCNQAHLTDVIKKQTGLTPKQIRVSRTASQALAVETSLAA